jgi:hypothetical protein
VSTDDVSNAAAACCLPSDSRSSDAEAERLGGARIRARVRPDLVTIHWDCVRSMAKGSSFIGCGTEAALLSLSSAEVEIRSALPLAVFSNVRIRLLGSDGSESAGEVYAKVLEASRGDSSPCVVRFTSSAELLDPLRRPAAGGA